MVASLAVLLVFQCLGEGLVYVFGLPLPGPVVGMLLLFGALLAFPALQERIEDTANELLRHLSLLFVPAGVGIVTAASISKGHWLALAGGLIGSTLLSLAVTATVLRLLGAPGQGDV
jgi:holin-like protein